MQESLPESLVRLLASAARHGGWGYSSDCSAPGAEPTALAALALVSAAREAPLAADALRWLASQQQATGCVPVAPGEQSPGWTTALAALAWQLCDANSHKRQISAAVTWLLSMRGRIADVKLSESQHDATIVGWPWVDGTHSWVEPTAYSVLALCACGHRQHPRTQDGLRLLRDRAIPSGGWNYGNSQVLAHTLRPFPETTGVALAALAGTQRDAVIEKAIAFLISELPLIRSPLALGWGLIGLRAWNAAPPAAAEWLRDALERGRSRPVNPLHVALLLLAALENNLLSQALWTEAPHG